jgi:streptogramin lyase
LGADKQGNFVYVCDYYGGNLAKIDIHTQKATLIPLPRPDSQEPYHATVDKDHNVWVNVMSSDSIMRFNPATSQWTEFTLPTLGAETRYISLLEQNGSLQVILPYSRARKVARMTLRTKEAIQALKAQVQQQEQARAR